MFSIAEEYFVKAVAKLVVAHLLLPSYYVQEWKAVKS